MRELNDLELQLLAHVVANPGYVQDNGKSRTKNGQRYHATFILEERGLITRERVGTSARLTATEAGAALVEGVSSVRAISPLQLRRQSIRRSNGQYDNVDPCECCGRRVLELWWSDVIEGAACDQCIREGKA